MDALRAAAWSHQKLMDYIASHPGGLDGFFASMEEGAVLRGLELMKFLRLNPGMAGLINKAVLHDEDYWLVRCPHALMSPLSGLAAAELLETAEGTHLMLKNYIENRRGLDDSRTEDAAIFRGLELSKFLHEFEWVKEDMVDLIDGVLRHAGYRLVQRPHLVN